MLSHSDRRKTQHRPKGARPEGADAGSPSDSVTLLGRATSPPCTMCSAEGLPASITVIQIGRKALYLPGEWSGVRIVSRSPSISIRPYWRVHSQQRDGHAAVLYRWTSTSCSVIPAVLNDLIDASSTRCGHPR